MVLKRCAILMGLLLASLGGLGQPSNSIYPKSQGVVSDYAGKLTNAQIGELTSLINNYERQTSIEFVVVVVESLHGLPVRAYAVSLADSWGVGKAGQDNGVVLLWAPNERAYSLRIADGLKAEMNDSDATRITQRLLLPKFKRGEYYAGLKETVVATMVHLGNKPWDERLQARAQAAQQERQDEQRRAQAAERERQAEEQRVQEQKAQADAALRLLGGAALFCVIAGFALIVFFRWRDRRKKRAELAQAGAVIAENLAKAEANVPTLQELLDDFAKEAPEQDLTAQRAELAAQAERIVKLRLDSTLVDFADLQSYDDMVRIRSAAEAEGDLLEATQGKIGEIRTAKARSQALMEKLSQENFAVSDVRDSSRRSEIDDLLSRSRQDYELARQNSSMSVVNWLMINEILNRSHSQVQEAVAYSQTEPDVPSRRYYDSSSSSSDSSSSSSGGWFSSSSSDSSSSSSDSGSSSFDSGSFGGGGGFSSGSGSDGSY